MQKEAHGIRRAFVTIALLAGGAIGSQPLAQPGPAAAAQTSASAASGGAMPGPARVVAPQPASAPASAPAEAPSALERGLALAEQVLKVLAYLVGGTWVYFNYFRGRTHRPRLETRVTCERLSTTAPVLLRVAASAKNTGLSKVDLADEGSAAVILGYDLNTGQWHELQAHSILTKDHAWIEPGETILDEILVRVDTSYPAYRVELFLQSPSKITWVAKTIVGPAKSEPEPHGG